MVRIGRGDACDRHVAVPACFDLFDARCLGQAVEFAEQLVETLDNLIGLHAGRNLSESDDIGKEDGGTLVMISDVAFTVAKASGNLGRQDVP